MLQIPAPAAGGTHTPELRPGQWRPSTSTTLGTVDVHRRLATRVDAAAGYRRPARRARRRPRSPELSRTYRSTTTHRSSMQPTTIAGVALGTRRQPDVHPGNGAYRGRDTAPPSGTTDGASPRRRSCSARSPPTRNRNGTRPSSATSLSERWHGQGRPSASEAVADIDERRVAGGRRVRFVRHPGRVDRGRRDGDATDLEVYSNNCGVDDHGLGILLSRSAGSAGSPRPTSGRTRSSPGSTSPVSSRWS